MDFLTPGMKINDVNGFYAKSHFQLWKMSTYNVFN